ncbi:ComEC family competence protein [Hyunsoonleella flava]|uniref:ComEC family competence protein n=1 Tax=Hyunsoonleella flava TaxID=2527939 RepID=A0A4Q9FDG9_9FLAO|nr:ComEC/Rec2 family competence protein [Hyunsoonleella flava]TBN02698.1 ComEC family competence protein [Hyunsoonleella flava]
MKLLNFTIIKLTIFFIVGILIGYHFSIETYTVIVLNIVSVIVLALLYVAQKRLFTKNIWFGLVAYLCMLNAGILTVNLHNQKSFSNHYSNYIVEDTASLHTINFRIREVLKPGNYYDKYVIDILQVDENKAIGKSLLNIEKDSTLNPLKVDDTYIVRTDFKNLINPLNPGQFNYKAYLKKKYIYHQLFIEANSLLKLDNSQTTIFGMANTFRAHVNSKLKPFNFKPDELAIINALLLGQRQDISEEVYTSYTNAGAIHILAVSGLHVGIILLILSFVLKPIERIKHGKLIKIILLVLMLWSFVIIAGLSASVTRAVTMFSIVAIGMNLNRPTNIYNTLTISILFILLFKPLFLFDVGFQLSYMAVFAIVTIDPLLYKLWQPKNWVLDKYWHTLTITIAAQFGIIPISLYYFHQFPALFFISNLVIIPFLGVVLGLGLLVILMAVLNVLPQLLASIFGTTISLMNSFVGWVSHQEAFLFKNIPFNFLYVLVFYGLIITSFRWFFRNNYSNLKYALIAIVLVQSAFIYNKYTKPNNQFIVFHKSRNSIIGQVFNNQITVTHDVDSIASSKYKIVRDFKVKKHIAHSVFDTIPSFYILNSKKVLVVDSLGAYNTIKLQPDYVLLRQSPKLNLERLISTLKPEIVIADGSNYKSYVERWERICQKQNIPFHQTSKKGAFVIDY